MPLRGHGVLPVSPESYERPLPGIESKEEIRQNIEILWSTGTFETLVKLGLQPSQMQESIKNISGGEQ